MNHPPAARIGLIAGWLVSVTSLGLAAEPFPGGQNPMLKFVPDETVAHLAEQEPARLEQLRERLESASKSDSDAVAKGSDPRESNNGIPLAIVAFAFLVVALATEVAEPSETPNIVVDIAADLGYVDVGFKFCKDISTPNFDRPRERSDLLA
ncbi:hypothetical protein [Lignipirellula cremea]|uniref:Uncharacterized protein n=1 Tax=Lignipirellula cremea TaxID=2528010 RepID=A0A518DL92_9BACT|nr:hypothetical protein [Lignipirellula cremea]QDU92604.1 hypothetical protein Pla8534_03520 [Lignipirellula cremea]